MQVSDNIRNPRVPKIQRWKKRVPPKLRKSSSSKRRANPIFVAVRSLGARGVPNAWSWADRWIKPKEPSGRRGSWRWRPFSLLQMLCVRFGSRGGRIESDGRRRTLVRRGGLDVRLRNALPLFIQPVRCLVVLPVPELAFRFLVPPRVFFAFK